MTDRGGSTSEAVPHRHATPAAINAGAERLLVGRLNLHCRPRADLDAWCAKQSVIQVESEKALDLRPPHLALVAQTVPFHEHPNPLHIGLFRTQAIVFVTNSLTDLIQQPCGAQHRGAAGFMAEFSTVFLRNLPDIKPCGKRFFEFFCDQFRPQAPDMASV